MKMLKNIVRNVVRGVKENVSTILCMILFASCMSVFMILCSLQMYTDSAIFLLFGIGIYWYIRLIRDETPRNLWYELREGKKKK